jgi:hypothetical protein
MLEDGEELIIQKAVPIETTVMVLKKKDRKLEPDDLLAAAVAFARLAFILC